MGDQTYNERRENLIDLIQEICRSGSPNLDELKLKEIKKICK